MGQDPESGRSTKSLFLQYPRHEVSDEALHWPVSNIKEENTKKRHNTKVKSIGLDNNLDMGEAGRECEKLRMT